MGRTREFDTVTALESAMEVFREYGYEGASTRKLTKAIGIGPGSLYAAFNSKEELYLAALRRHNEYLEDTISQALASNKRVREVIKGLLERTFKGSDPIHWGPGCLLLRAAAERAGRNPSVDRMLADALRATESAFTELIMTGRRRGEIAEDVDAVAAAHFLVTALQGLRVMALMGSNPKDLSTATEITLRCMG